MVKPLCLIRAPIATRSGYGDAARDIARHIIEYEKFDVLIHSVPWGDTPMNALDEKNPKDKMLMDRILKENLTTRPDLFVSVTVPNEFEPVGKYNIGITAGIETTLASPEWIMGCNRMDTVWCMSNFSKEVLANSKYNQQSPNGQPMGELKVEKPLDVLHNCIDTKIMRKIEYESELDKSIKTKLDEIPEKFNYLFVGHWLRGDFGEDRKNVGVLVKIFLETFKQVKNNQPGLILKTSGAGFSILDQEDIIKKINFIKASVKLENGQKLPNVYLLHGELTDSEMNSLYNHPKVKVHVSFTKGEGFGRPLLEASMSGKPIVASGWSGHMDFTNKDQSLLVSGQLTNVHPSAAWDKVLLTEASWFSIDMNHAANLLYAAYMDYPVHKKKAGELMKQNKAKFNYETIKKNTFDLLDKYVPEFPKQVEIKLPTTKKKVSLKKKD
jgi:glycosyltransferase involved in cell wall biosynthesis